MKRQLNRLYEFVQHYLLVAAVIVGAGGGVFIAFGTIEADRPQVVLTESGPVEGLAPKDVKVHNWLWTGVRDDAYVPAREKVTEAGAVVREEYKENKSVINPALLSLLGLTVFFLFHRVFLRKSSPEAFAAASRGLGGLVTDAEKEELRRRVEAAEKLLSEVVAGRFEDELDKEAQNAVIAEQWRAALVQSEIRQRQLPGELDKARKQLQAATEKVEASQKQLADHEALKAKAQATVDSLTKEDAGLEQKIAAYRTKLGLKPVEPVAAKVSVPAKGGVIPPLS